MKLSDEYRKLYNAAINQLSDEKKKSYDESIVKNALIDFITSAEHDLRERESQAWWEARHPESKRKSQAWWEAREREDKNIKKFRERSNIEILNRQMDKLLNGEYGNITDITTALKKVIKSIVESIPTRKMQGGYKRKRTIKKKRKRSKQSKKVKSKSRKRTKRK